MSNFVAGLDLAQANDWTALVICEHLQRHIGFAQGPIRDDEGFVAGYKTVERLEDVFHVVHAQRWRGTAYPVLVDTLTDLLRRPPLAGQTDLVVDATGVGRPVLDLLDAAKRSGALDTWARPVTITAGLVEGAGTVPKYALVQAVEVALQTGRLRIADGLPLAPVLREELLNFQAKVSPTGHARFEAAGAGHDDLVVALALAVFRRPRLLGDPSRIDPEGRMWRH